MKMDPRPLQPKGSRGKVEARRQRLPELTLMRYPDPVLRAICAPVESFDSSLRDIVQGMFGVLETYGGIGLATPQVNLQQRVLVGCIYEQRVCLVNPEIQDASRPGVQTEGCLSLPGVEVQVRRPERLRVAAYDLRGRKTSFGASGLWARLIQHEMDHLNGVLICDYCRPAAAECEQCALALPAVLIEDRKRRLYPDRPTAHNIHRKPKEKRATTHERNQTE